MPNKSLEIVMLTRSQVIVRYLHLERTSIGYGTFMMETTELFSKVSRFICGVLQSFPNPTQETQGSSFLWRPAPRFWSEAGNSILPNSQARIHECVGKVTELGSVAAHLAGSQQNVAWPEANLNKIIPFSWEN